MKKQKITILLSFVLSVLLSSCGQKTITEKQKLARTILNDSTLVVADSMARAIIKEGFNAGSGYSQIWARDLNTFIETAIEVTPREDIRRAIVLFFELQQKNGEMIDGYVLKEDFTWHDDTPYYSDLAPNHVAFKNTVETDQETSLIQLLSKYVIKTGDTTLLNEKVGDKTIAERIDLMLNYLMTERYNKDYGLLWGAMTADWGDVQPKDDFGCDWNDLSDQAIDVYDNAMLIIALNYLDQISPDAQKKAKWKAMSQDIAQNVRKHLWDAKAQKFIPHIYPTTSPIPDGFDENAIHYHGGTTIAMEAGLLSKNEIKTVNDQMLENVKLSGMPTIGLTMYPTYPKNFFRGWMAEPYVYQNGGDWMWFGGRTIQELVKNGLVEEAYTEIQPMVDLVLKHQGYYEWYGKGGVPGGSGKFKGAAGALSKAIYLLRDWAEKNK